MKLTLVLRDKKNTLKLSTKTIESFMERIKSDTKDRIVGRPDFGDASPKNTNWAGAPTSDYRKLQKFFFLTK